MSEQKDQIIEAQKQVIGILFEVVKRLQANNDLDSEYFQMASMENARPTKSQMEQIMTQREENAKIVGRLLEQLDT